MPFRFKRQVVDVKYLKQRDESLEEVTETKFFFGSSCKILPKLSLSYRMVKGSLSSNKFFF